MINTDIQIRMPLSDDLIECIKNIYSTDDYQKYLAICEADIDRIINDEKLTASMKRHEIYDCIYDTLVFISLKAPNDLKIKILNALR